MSTVAELSVAKESAVSQSSSSNMEQEEERLREKLKARLSKDNKQRGDAGSHDDGSKGSVASSKRSSVHTSTSRQRDGQRRDRSRSRSGSARGSRGGSPPPHVHGSRHHHSRRDDHYHGDSYYRGDGHRDHRGGGGRRGPPPPPGRHYDDRYDHRGGPDYRGGRGGYYGDHRGPPPPHDAPYGPPHPGRDGHYYDDFGRQRPPPPMRRSRSPNNDRKVGRSRSRSRSPPPRRHRRRSRSYSSSGSSRSSSSASSRSYSSSSSRSSRSHDDDDVSSTGSMERESVMTKDQRTVFVNQLVQKATERDVRLYFNRKGYRVNEVILLRDRRTSKHKGCAYVELRKLEHVQPCIFALNDQVPDFQKFPILIKASEAEKNYAGTTTNVVATAATGNVTKVAAAAAAQVAPVFPLDSFGNPIMSQKVYVGGLNPSVTHDHLLALFGPFGSLVSVQMQIDAATQSSKGFAFLQFVDARDANLAIQSMAGQSLAGQALKTGWGNQVGGASVVTSEEFPPDAAAKTQAAYSVLKQLNMGQAVAMVGQVAKTTVSANGIVRATVPQPGTVAEARASLAAAAAATTVPPAAMVPAAVLAPNAANQSAGAAGGAPLGDASAKEIGNAEHPSRHILIHNMFDKDQETEPGWEGEIKEEFISEAKKFGILERCVVMAKLPGGKIYASFMLLEGAKTCASTLAGRWFDKRQLRVEYVSEDEVPKEE
ncbi:hypothetical protein MPSEU_000694700 [Mayamaea pseudoterrestris]|nr:hypothetical protein MPSEU_000694700 [Mayamaea pseudoterrestris]